MVLALFALIAPSAFALDAGEVKDLLAAGINEQVIIRIAGKQGVSFVPAAAVVSLRQSGASDELLQLLREGSGGESEAD